MSVVRRGVSRGAARNELDDGRPVGSRSRGGLMSRVEHIAPSEGDFNMRRIIVTAMVGLAVLALALGQATPTNEESAVRAAVESYTSAFNNGNLDGVLAHVAADAD